MSTIRQASRKDYNISGTRPKDTEIQLGAILRIADAAEAMAQDHARLIRDKESYRRLLDLAESRNDKLSRSNAALRGIITKLKNKLK